jgi:hypothetical protein
MTAGVTSPTRRWPRCGCRKRSRIERVSRVVVGAHEVEAIANHASSNSFDTVEREPIVLSDWTSAARRASARSASPRLPVTVVVR